MERDKIDFGKDRVATLFRKMFVPTLFGMLSICAVTMADGIFVGHGVGSSGIAAVNLCIPLLMVFTGLGLMLGVGSSVVASIHLSTGNEKAARINVTQALWASSLLTLVAGLLILAFPSATARLLGASESLERDTILYLWGFIPCLVFQMWESIGLFALRLDGSPKLAMWVNIIGAVVNVVLDWWFIFPLQMGVFGAALASTLAIGIAAAIVFVYLGWKARHLRFYSLKLTAKSLRLSIRNLGYQCEIGFSSLLGEATMAVFMYMGNLMFMRYLGDNGVGAFGIACYYCPFVFMMGNAIAQSAQPIISYNISTERVRSVKAQHYALITGLFMGLLVMGAFIFAPGELVGLFIPLDDAAAAIAIEGFPEFGLGVIPFIINLVAIGWYQSVERPWPATCFALLRGAVFLIPSYIILPHLLGPSGIWLSMPASESLALLSILLFYLLTKRQSLQNQPV
ncbi:MAG: MATE family efflux transporter [Bacteroidales bacterium]|nr:MATE family efflux transporter [Bacteroidales bacterium]